MSKKFSKLFLINILFHLNNFLYLIFSSKIEKNILYELWNITPTIFIVLSYDFMEYSYKNKLSIRNKVIVDFIVRILAFVAIFYSREDKVIFFGALMVITLIINILVELDIKKDIYNNNYYKDIKEFDLYENEKLDNLIKKYYYYKNMDLDKCDLDNRFEVDKMFKLEKMEKWSKGITFWLMYIPIIFLDDFEGRIRIYIGILLLILLYIYIRISSEKFSYFYKNNKMLKRKNIKNSIFLFVGISILYIIKAFIHKNTLIELRFETEIWIMIIGVAFCNFSMNENQGLLNKYSGK